MITLEEQIEYMRGAVAGMHRLTLMGQPSGYALPACEAILATLEAVKKDNEDWAILNEQRSPITK